jgi:WD repeat-containing protein 35
MLLSLNEPDAAAATSHTIHNIDKGDVWDVKWASDDPHAFAVMEKTKLSIVRGVDSEPPVITSHYVASFEDLEALMVDLDGIMREPEVRLQPHGPPQGSAVC